MVVNHLVHLILNPRLLKVYLEKNLKKKPQEVHVCMVGINANQLTNQPWLVQDVVAIPGVVHPLPKHPDKFLPKFDPDKKDSAKLQPLHKIKI